MNPVMIAAVVTLASSVLGPLVGHYLEIRRSAAQQKGADQPLPTARSVVRETPVRPNDLDILVAESAENQKFENWSSAHVGVRFLAFVMDMFLVMFIVFLVAGAVTGLTGMAGHEALLSEDGLGLVIGASFYGLWLVYCVVGWTRWGTTVGKRIFGYYVVSTNGQVGLSSGRAFARFVGYILGLFTLWIPFLVALGNPQRRALHDYMAASFVVRLK